jgi:uncharacterized membrane protein
VFAFGLSTGYQYMQVRPDSLHSDVDRSQWRTSGWVAVVQGPQQEDGVPFAMKLTSRSILVFFCCSGIGLSLASLHSHYAVAATEYCDLNEIFNCDLVNRSRFSEIFGIPVALIGLLGYLVLLGLTFARKRALESLRLGLSSAGLVFALYLAYIEEHVLRTWCLLCIGSLIAMTGIAILSFLAMRKSTPGKAISQDLRGDRG